MIQDRQGNPLHGANAGAAACYDQAVEAFNVYRGDPVALLDRAAEAAPEFALARVAKAWLLALATEPAATAAAREIASTVERRGLDARTASLLAALDELLAGGWSAAAGRLDRHNADYPHDLLALQAGHLVDFFRAGSRSLRDRIARALPQWSPEQPGYAILLGMYSFGLEETGAYGAAEEMGRRAIDLEPRDCWAQHAVGDRWQELAEAWRPQADGGYPFNDWHAAMSALGAGRDDLLEEIVRGLRAAGAAPAETGAWAREIGLPLVEGFRAFRDGDHVRAVDCLLGVRQEVNRLGGSHAQRDVIDWTVAEAAARGGLGGLARGLANERLALKPHSPVNRAFLRRVCAAGCGRAPGTPAAPG